MGGINLWINEVAKYHNDWIRILKSLGCDYYAEDIVQEMYITLLRRSSPEKVFTNGQVYFPYIYFCLRNSYFNYLKEKNKVTKVDLDSVQIEVIGSDYEDKVAFEDFSEQIRDILQNEHWYFERVYDIYTGVDNPSYRDMARDTEISFMTIYNDMKKIKSIINDNKSKLQDEWNDL
jgi:DNA-directed RNA polymerase specialized sigma24 family protein